MTIPPKGFLLLSWEEKSMTEQRKNGAEFTRFQDDKPTP